LLHFKPAEDVKSRWLWSDYMSLDNNFSGALQNFPSDQNKKQNVRNGRFFKFKKLSDVL